MQSSSSQTTNTQALQNNVNGSGNTQNFRQQTNLQQTINNYIIILSPQTQIYEQRQQEQQQLQLPLGPQAMFPNVQAPLPFQNLGNPAFGSNFQGGFVPGTSHSAFNSFSIAQSIALSLSQNSIPPQFSMTLINLIIQQQTATQNVQNAIQLLTQNQQALAMQLQLINQLQYDVFNQYLIDLSTLQQALIAVSQLQLIQQQQAVQVTIQPQANPSAQGNQTVNQTQGSSNSGRQDSKSSNERMSGISDE